MTRSVPVGVWVWVTLALTLALASCGGGGSSQAEMGTVETEAEMDPATAGGEGGDTMIMSGVDLSSEDQETVGDFDQMIASYDAQMLNDPSGCTVACEMKDRVCDLSERICTIAERHPRDGRLGSRCTDGRDRCQRASEAVERCGCSDGGGL